MVHDDKTNAYDNQAFERRDGSIDLQEPPAKGKNGELVGAVVSGVKVLTPEEKREKISIIKNIIIISIAFMFLFTSYNSMANLQSSINKVDGTAALSTLYGALVVSCCFLPSWFIKTLKVKYTMAVCMLCYSTYIAAQFYPQIYTLVPTAVILGLGAAPMWSAKCTYLTKVGARYAELVGDDKEVIITRFFGVFFLFFQSTQVWGNLISSSILSVGINSTEKSVEDLEKCGFNFCPWDSSGNSSNSTDSDEPPKWQIYTMASVYLVFSLLSSVIIILFVDPLSTFVGKETYDATADKTGVQLLVATFNHMRHPYQLLVIPLTIWSGVEQAFLGADYTAAYVSCGLGVHMVGYIMICYGVCDAVCSVSFSPLVKIVGRVPIFVMGFSINLSIIITLIYWSPNPEDLPVFYILAGLWGVSDAVWQTQINALYGVIFPGESEAAFSNYRLWESIGFIIAYACSTVVCINTKITILLVFLVLGFVGYFAIEMVERCGGLKKNKEGKVVTLDQLVTGKYE
ncbi:UNC93-like protein [Procambarus clarkii]|uniref:UNC93-like protein n=1 Tax=Procambarus clarkii TaxID=6728 RepID=UPI001E67408F|nr:UNC93-like protein [Procambarus clarkii]XP_045611695.1 UNC93-like protein [Procambarus clarkii]XP_045611696.1 UNC93-like protein [Procambarus clarkii]